MDFLNKFDLKPGLIIKTAGISLAAIIVIAFGLKMISSSFDGLNLKTSGLSDNSAGRYYQKGGGSSEYDSDNIKLSTRNAESMMPPQDQSPSGDTAEDYEITEYSATIETRTLEKTCHAVASLKPSDYVIFENANEYDHGCSYVFKVEQARAEEILAVINGLDPKDLTENTKTIKKRIDDFTSEVEILEKKKETIEDTLNDAINSYDEIAALATKTRDVESLAKIIDSKIRIIEKLSQERININAQLDRLSRAKAEQLDRLEYTYFRVNIFENKYIDAEAIKDSWKSAIKRFVRDMNKILQDISINLITVIFTGLQYLIYFFIILIAAKFAWSLAKRVWRK